MAEKKVKMPEAKITDEMLESVRKLIGTSFRIAHAINNEEATRLAIAKFVDGIGDPNPLWRDSEYAKRTRYGGIIAPPQWVWAVFTSVQFGWRGLGGFHSGSEIEYYKPVYLNDNRR